MLLLLTLLVILFATVFLLHNNTVKKIKKNIHNSWGRINPAERNFNKIEKYRDYDKGRYSQKLTNQTLIDIDIETLFSFLDRTTTLIGKQYLYSKITQPKSQLSELINVKTEADHFTNNREKREFIQYQLHRFEKGETDLIVDFFSDKNVVVKPKYNFLYKLLTLLAVVSIVGIFVIPHLITILLGLILLGLNLTLHLFFRFRDSEKLKAIRQVYRLARYSKIISLQKSPVNVEEMQPALKKLSKFNRAYHFLDLGIPANDISSIAFYLLDLVKAFFLVEIHLLNYTYNSLILEKVEVNKLFCYIGRIEMAISIASLKDTDGVKMCFPNLLIQGKILSFSNATHPLIPNCIPNSIDLNTTSAFITGSNMSGKSTFLRTVLINSILAQSLFLCFADKYTSSIQRSFSSIKIVDNLIDGKSFYFEEVNIIHKMINEVIFGEHNIFIIDEIFKGTNTIERISLAKSILHYLNSKDNIVIASSHDLELLTLLEGPFDKYYFTETILDNQLFFDHKIKMGSLETRNAIKIIEIEGFPGEIVEDAYSTAMQVKANSLFQPKNT